MYFHRHGQHVHREDDGAVQFWISHIVTIGLIASGKHA